MKNSPFLRQEGAAVICPGWYQLGISYDPDTNQVTGSFDGQDFTFTLDYDLLGTFFSDIARGSRAGTRTPQGTTRRLTT